MTTTIDAEEEDYLYVEQSQIANAGKGLYTAIDIFKDEVIALYKGEILTKTEEHKRKSNDEYQYFIVMLDGSIMDSKHTHCFAKYANDAQGFKNNAKITLDEENNVCLVAIKKIKSGEEIFCSYGRNYWRKHKKIN